MPKTPAKRAAASKPTSSTLPVSIVNAAKVSIDLMQHLRAIEKLIPAMAKDMERAEKGGTVTLARAFVAFHRMMEARDDIMKPLDALYDLYKKERIPAVFEQAGIPNQPLDEGFRVGLSQKFYASIRGAKDDPALAKKLKDGAYQWLRENGLGDIITTSVNAQTLSAAGKELVEDKNIELPAEFFNTAWVPNTSVTKTR